MKYKKKYFLILIIISITLFSSCVLNKPIQKIENGYANIFTKIYGSNYTDRVGEVIFTSDGGILLGGYINFKADAPSYVGNVDINQAHNGVDLFLLKLDSNGEEEWQRIYGGSGAEWALTVQETDDGYIVGGYTTSTDGDLSELEDNGRGPARGDPWLIKIDFNGNIVWQKLFPMENTRLDRIGQIKNTDDGGFVTIIQRQKNYDFEEKDDVDEDVIVEAFSNIFQVLKLDPIGEIEWEFTWEMEEIPELKEDLIGFYPTSIDVDRNGDYIISFYERISPTENFSKIMKLSSSGDIEWVKKFGKGNTDLITKVIDYKGGYLFAGHSNSDTDEFSSNKGDSDYWITRLDNEGNVIWQKLYGGNARDRANEIAKTPEGNILVTGYTRSNNGDVKGFHGNYDIWLLKLNENGELINQKCFGGTADDRGVSVAVLEENVYLVAGYINSSNGTFNVNYGSSDIALIKFFMEASENSN